MPAALNETGPEPQANGVLYNVPADGPLVAQARSVVLRSADPAALSRAVVRYPAEAVAWVQLLGVPADATVFEDWPDGVPVDLVLCDPAREHPALYRCAALIDRHPVRVTIPVVPGFGKAVKLALSLHFAVKLQIGQPDPIVLEELGQVLDLYLHGTTVDQPVEFFHSVLFALMQDHPVNLWDIQEEDPAHFRLVTDDGREIGAGRLGGAEPLENPEGFVAQLRAAQLDGGECATCAHVEVCGSYFKWPDPSYSCAGIKSLFQILCESARELASDVALATPPPST